MTENAAFNEIYSKFKNLVLKAAHIYVDDLDAAEDIMQETFLALCKDMREKGFDRVEEYTNIKSWLYTTAKHFALNYRRKMSRVVSMDEMKDAGVWEDPSTESLETMYFSTEADRMKAELHERVFTALMKKNPRWREAIMMVVILEMSEAEAAESLGITANAFYVMMHRARNWIRKNFNVDYEELKRY